MNATKQVSLAIAIAILGAAFFLVLWNYELRLEEIDNRIDRDLYGLKNKYYSLVYECADLGYAMGKAGLSKQELYAELNRVIGHRTGDAKEILKPKHKSL